MLLTTVDAVNTICWVVVFRYMVMLQERLLALLESQANNVVKHRARDPPLSSPCWVEQ